MNPNERIEKLEKRVADLEKQVATATTTKSNQELVQEVFKNLPESFDKSKNSTIGMLVEAIIYALKD